jgi:hypothetical protein
MVPPWLAAPARTGLRAARGRFREESISFMSKFRPDTELPEPYRTANLAVHGGRPTMETAKLTVRLPKRSLEFAKEYAREHEITVTDLIARYLQRLQAEQPALIHPDVERFSGILADEDVDDRALYHEHVERKHR